MQSCKGGSADLMAIHHWRGRSCCPPTSCISGCACLLFTWCQLWWLSDPPAIYNHLLIQRKPKPAKREWVIFSWFKELHELIYGTNECPSSHRRWRGKWMVRNGNAKGKEMWGRGWVARPLLGSNAYLRHLTCLRNKSLWGIEMPSVYRWYTDW